VPESGKSIKYAIDFIVLEPIFSFLDVFSGVIKRKKRQPNGFRLPKMHFLISLFDESFFFAGLKKGYFNLL